MAPRLGGVLPRHSGPLICNTDEDYLILDPRADLNHTFLWRGIDRVVENIGPHLTQTRTGSLDLWHFFTEDLVDFELFVAEFVSKYGQGALNAVVNIDLAL